MIEDFKKKKKCDVSQTVKLDKKKPTQIRTL